MTDLFAETPAEPTPEPTEQPEGIVTTLVGADKSFKTVDDLAKAKLESDRFIEQLKEEAAEMRKVLQEQEKVGEEQATIEKLMEKLTEASNKPEVGNQPELTEEGLRKLIGEEVSVREQTQARLSNREKANIAVLDKFANDSEKAKSFIAEQTKKLGLTPDMLGNIAETSPDAFKQLMGLAPKSTATGSFQPAHNSEAVAASLSAGGERNYAYYSKLRKELKSKYFEPRIQQQKMKDAERLGAKFFDN